MTTLSDQVNENKRGQSKEWRDLKAECNRYRKALEHYANRRNWTQFVDGPKLKAEFLGCENARGYSVAEHALKN